MATLTNSLPMVDLAANSIIATNFWAILVLTKLSIRQVIQKRWQSSMNNIADLRSIPETCQPGRLADKWIMMIIIPSAWD